MDCKPSEESCAPEIDTLKPSQQQPAEELATDGNSNVIAFDRYRNSGIVYRCHPDDKPRLSVRAKTSDADAINPRIALSYKLKPIVRNMRSYRDLGESPSIYTKSPATSHWLVQSAIGDYS